MFPCHDRKLKKEVDLIQTGHMDAQLKDLWADVTQYDTPFTLTLTKLMSWSQTVIVTYCPCPEVKSTCTLSPTKPNVLMLLKSLSFMFFFLIRKKKQDEEEAEQKRKATEAAYQGKCWERFCFTLAFWLKKMTVTPKILPVCHMSIPFFCLFVFFCAAAHFSMMTIECIWSLPQQLGRQWKTHRSVSPV